MSSIPQKTVEEIQRKMDSGDDFLLVCAYEKDEQFQKNHLEGAISLKDLRAMEKDLPITQEIIFYCH